MASRGIRDTAQARACDALLRSSGSVGPLCRNLQLFSLAFDRKTASLPAAIMAACPSLASLELWTGRTSEWQSAMGQASSWASLANLTLFLVRINGFSLASILERTTELATLHVMFCSTDTAIAWPTAQFRTGVRHLHVYPSDWTATQWRLFGGVDERGRLLDTVELERTDDFEAAARALAERNDGLGLRTLSVRGRDTLRQSADAAAQLGPLFGSRLEEVHLADSAAAISEHVFQLLPPTLVALTLCELTRCDYTALIAFLHAERSPALLRVHIDRCGWSTGVYRQIGERCRVRAIESSGHRDLALVGL